MNENQLDEGAPVTPVASVEPVEPVVPVAPTPVVPVAPVVPVTPIAPLPEDVKERTKSQFDKLIESNKKMSEEIRDFKEDLAKRDDGGRAVMPTPTTPQAPINENDFIEIDPKTGEQFINGQTLRAKLEEANNKAIQAEKIIKQYIAETEQKEAQKQNDEAFAAYPELNPNGKDYDPNFTKHVRGILQDSMWNVDDYDGRPLSFKAAADFIKSEMKPKEKVLTPEEQKKADDKAAEAKATKEQISAQPETKSGNSARENFSDDDKQRDLVYRTRYLNDDNALAERLKATEHILPKEAKQV